MNILDTSRTTKWMPKGMSHMTCTIVYLIGLIKPHPLCLSSVTTHRNHYYFKTVLTLFFNIINIALTNIFIHVHQYCWQHLFHAVYIWIWSRVENPNCYIYVRRIHGCRKTWDPHPKLQLLLFLKSAQVHCPEANNLIYAWGGVFLRFPFSITIIMWHSIVY